MLEAFSHQQRNDINMFDLSKSFANKNNIQIINASKNQMLLIYLMKFENHMYFRLFNTLELQANNIVIEINVQNEDLNQYVQNIGRFRFLQKVNKFNRQCMTPLLFAWEQDRQSLIIRQFINVHIANNAYILEKIHQIWKVIEKFLQKLFPVTKKQWTVQHQKMKKSVLQKLDSLKQIIILRKKQKIPQLMDAKHEQQITEYFQYKHLNIFKAIEKQKKDWNTIIRKIRIINKKDIEPLPKKFDMQCNIIQYKYTYSLNIGSDSIHLSSDLLLENSAKFKCSQTYEEILLKKEPFQWNPNPFKREKKIIVYLRNEKCPYISNYYLQTSQKIQDIKKIYLPGFRNFLCEKFVRTKKIQMFQKIAKGLQFLVSKKVLHRNLKPENIMIDDQLCPKIAHFQSGVQSGKATFLNNTHDNHSNINKVYNIVWKQLPRQIKSLISEDCFNRHQLFDVFAFGKLIEKIFDNYQSKCELGTFMSLVMHFLTNQSINLNPEQRIHPIQILIFLQQLKIYQQKGLLIF